MNALTVISFGITTHNILQKQWYLNIGDPRIYLIVLILIVRSSHLSTMDVTGVAVGLGKRAFKKATVAILKYPDSWKLVAYPDSWKLVACPDSWKLVAAVDPCVTDRATLKLRVP